MQDMNRGRREFCRHAACGLAGVLLLGGRTVALAIDKVSESEELARNLGYYEDASRVDTARFPKRAGDPGTRQFCDNCALFAGEEGDSTAPCSMFQGRLVVGRGWCNAWVAKP